MNQFKKNQRCKDLFASSFTNVQRGSLHVLQCFSKKKIIVTIVIYYFVFLIGAYKVNLDKNCVKQLNDFFTFLCILFAYIDINTILSN